ncbi:MAG: protein translocase subunit SecD, partial [Spirochaetaceae bacterium]|nr:protein translocase subunit SecD [Spirochaetaceae bacterium]
MSKRYRFFIILAIMGICFAFLLPSIRWYFFVPKLEQTRALASRDQIRSYSSQAAQADLQNLIGLARSGGELPGDLSFLIAQARKNYKAAKLPEPAKWDAHAVLSAFSSRPEALEAIESVYRDRIFALKDLQKNAVQLGLDLSGGLSIVLQANFDSLRARMGGELTEAIRQEAVDQALEVLNNRIDRFGLTEPVIRRQGQDQIYVEIPGVADPERINSIIMGRGGLAFHMVDEEATNEFNAYYKAHPADTFDARGNLLNPAIVRDDVVIRGVYIKDRYGLDEQARDDDGNLRYAAIKKEVGLDGNHIQRAEVERNSFDGQPGVTFILDSEGGDIFYRLTSANVKKPLAIVLEDRIKSQATINEPIRDSVRLTGFSTEEANNIALTLRTAALPVELDVVSQQSIGASLGEDTITRGIYALLWGLIAVLVFMLIFYKGAGVNAVIA